jgi:hypothetical protein
MNAKENVTFRMENTNQKDFSLSFCFALTCTYCRSILMLVLSKVFKALRLFHMCEQDLNPSSTNLVSFGRLVLNIPVILSCHFVMISKKMFTF